MTTRERVLAVKLLEKQERNPTYTQHIGVNITIVKKTNQEKEETKRHA